MAIRFKQKCFRCKKNYVIVGRGQKFVLCYDCQKNELKGEIKDKKMKKLFDIPEEFYEKNSFLRDIKINYLKFGKLTEKQIEAFKKTVEKMKNPKELKTEPASKNHMDKQLSEALKTALQNEIAGEDFYLKTAKESKDDFTRNTFTHLAKDELFHIKRIKDFMQTEKADEIETEIRNRNPKAGFTFFKMSEEEFKKKEKEYKGNFAAYEFAIDLEIKSYNLYKEQFEKAKDQKTKDFFKFLMKEEKTHKKILEEAISFLKEPADYFLEAEGWHFD